MNVEAAAKVLLRNSDAPLSKPADVLVYSEKGFEIAGLEHCRALINEGCTVFNSLCSTPEEAVEYAKAHGIHRVDIVGVNSDVTIKEV